MQPTLIYDGECGFCISSMRWAQNRTDFQAFPFQGIDPSIYGVTKAQCEKSVVFIGAQTLFGADAIAELMKLCGHRFISRVIKLSGPAGRNCYQYVATHRSGYLVKALHWVIRKTI